MHELHKDGTVWDVLPVHQREDGEKYCTIISILVAILMVRSTDGNTDNNHNTNTPIPIHQW